MSSQPANQGSSQVTGRQLLLLGVLTVVLLAVLGVTVVRPMLSRAGDQTPPPQPQAAPQPAPTTTSTTVPGSGGDSSARVMVPAVASRTAKDPFEPLVVETTSDETTETTQAPESGVDDPGAFEPDFGPSFGSSGMTVEPGDDPSGQSWARSRLKLVSIAGSGSDATVTIEVDGVQFSGSPGDVLAGIYELVGATRECADFRVDGDTFTVCERRSARK